MQKMTIEKALLSARETRGLEIGKNILGRASEMFRQHFPNCTAVIVADTQTFAIAGKTVADAFTSAAVKCEPPFVFDDPDLYAEIRFVEKLEAALKKHNAIPVAVGSGVVNDLAKLAAHRVGRRYMSVATAASMDGYTAFGASITYQGSKQTFNCPAPMAVLADIEVIRRAPPEMAASGYADVIAKIPAGADWILADALGVEPIQQEAWEIVQPGLREAVSNPQGARCGDDDAIRLLTEALMLGGFGMQSARSSRSASGAEHQFSHLWDMQHHTYNGVAPSHGFKVGIGTLASTALYERLLAQPLEALNVDRCVESWPEIHVVEAAVKKLFADDDFTEKALEETRAKYIDRDALGNQLEKLRQQWPALRTRLQQQLIPFGKVKQMLRDAGAPFEPEQIGISRERLRSSFLQAYYIRRRFTILDVAVRTNLLASSVDVLFGNAGVWPIDSK
jgi:glycerol-1-phosphate dehydrogenase [NAD(P)+]